jgi:hypothetical protein
MGIRHHSWADRLPSEVRFPRPEMKAASYRLISHQGLSPRQHASGAALWVVPSIAPCQPRCWLELLIEKILRRRRAPHVGSHLYVAPYLAPLREVLVHAPWLIDAKLLIHPIEFAEQLNDLPVGIAVVG